MEECISEFKRNKLEQEAQKNWDLFYKRNACAFFKDRHWTRNEFAEVLSDVDLSGCVDFLEVGCGVGNLLVPLAEYYPSWRLHGTDFSHTAIDLLNRRALEEGIADRVSASSCDITNEEESENLLQSFSTMDIVTLVFVLSSISPEKHSLVIGNLRGLIRPGGSLVVRDYATNDHAMLRFGRGAKISDRFYKRIDGTRAYFFTKEEVERLFTSNGFICQQLDYLRRKTINRKEQLEVDRIFIQGRFVVPNKSSE